MIKLTPSEKEQIGPGVETIHLAPVHEINLNSEKFPIGQSETKDIEVANLFVGPITSTLLISKTVLIYFPQEKAVLFAGNLFDLDVSHDKIVRACVYKRLPPSDPRYSEVRDWNVDTQVLHRTNRVRLIAKVVGALRDRAGGYDSMIGTSEELFNLRNFLENRPGSRESDI